MSKRKHHSWVQDSLLIAEVEKRRCLFDKIDEHFTNYDLRKDMWEEIGETVGLSDSEAKHRFRDIRDCFIKCLKRGQENANANKPIRNYRYASNLKFLLPHISIGESSFTTEEDDQHSNELEESGWEVEGYQAIHVPSATPIPHHPQTSTKRRRSEDQEELSAVMLDEEDQHLVKNEHREEEDEEVEDYQPTRIPLAATQIRHHPQTTVKRRRPQDHNGEPMVDNPVRHNSTPGEDELDSFFKTICTTVRKLPLVIQSKLRFQIMEIVYKAELGHLSN